MLKCPLCNSESIQEINTEKDPRIYYLCDNCFLIFAHPDHHLPREVEKERYSHHHNGIEHPGYVNFLNQAINPTLPFLKKGMTGLDYGCGPVPTLSKLLNNQGFSCYDFDPLFGFTHPFQKYDFIFATECFEHFFYPNNDLRKIGALLNPGAYLTVMTERWKDLDMFRTWYYKKDPSHISFYHTKTFAYIADHLKLQIRDQDENRVTILQA